MEALTSHNRHDFSSFGKLRVSLSISMLRVFVTESENGIDGYKSVEAIIIEHSRSRDGLNLFNYSSTFFLKKN